MTMKKGVKGDIRLTGVSPGLSIIVILLVLFSGCTQFPFQGKDEKQASTRLASSYQDTVTGISFLYPYESGVVRIPLEEGTSYRVLLPGQPPETLVLTLLPDTPFPRQALYDSPLPGSGYSLIRPPGPVPGVPEAVSRTVGHSGGGREMRLVEAVLPLKGAVVIGALHVSEESYPIYSPVFEQILASIRLEPSRVGKIPFTPGESQDMAPVTLPPLYLRGDVVQASPLSEGYHQDLALLVLLSGKDEYTTKPITRYPYYDGWYAFGPIQTTNRTFLEREYPRRIDSVDPAYAEALPRDPLEHYQVRNDLSPYSLTYNVTTWKIFSPNEKYQQYRFEPSRMILPYREGFQVMPAEDRTGVVRMVSDPLIEGVAGVESRVYLPLPVSNDYNRLTGVVLEVIRFKDRASAEAFYQGRFSRARPVTIAGLDASHEFFSGDGGSIVVDTVLLGDTAVIGAAFDHRRDGRDLAGETTLDSAARAVISESLQPILG